jgi:hypothetical protein
LQVPTLYKDEMTALRCRFYENQFPEPEEVVMVNVTEIGEMGAYVTLLEYDDIEVSAIVANTDSTAQLNSFSSFPPD